MYTFESLHPIFLRNKVGYWFVVDANKRRVAVVSEALKDQQDGQKQYDDFVEAMEQLSDGDYTVTLRTKETASRSDMPYKFSKGDAMPARNNTPSVGNVREQNFGGSNNMMNMVIQMMMQQQQQQNALMLQMMTMQKESDKNLFDEKLERYKVENSKVKGIGEQILTAVPHIAPIIAAMQGAPQPTAAIGRAEAPPPPKNTVPPEADKERQRAIELGKRINIAFQKIQKHFPEYEPIYAVEVVVSSLENPIIKQAIKEMLQNGNV